MATMSAAQRRAQERLAYDAYLEVCPSRQVLDRLSDKWVSLVLCALDETGGPLRHSQLARQIAGASQKMLTQTLRNLERDGLVTRTVTATVPVTVHYELSDLGSSIIGPIRALKAWSECHIAEVEAARSAYDLAREEEAAG